MKKIIACLLVIFVVVLNMTSCNDTDKYKIISLGDFGQISIPEEWVCSEENGIVYFTDKNIQMDDSIIYMKGFIFDQNNEMAFQDDNKDLEAIFEKYCNGDSLHVYSEGLSNGTCIGAEKMIINNITQTINYLNIENLNAYDNNQVYYFFSIDKEIPRETLKKIAGSYSSETIE